MNAHPTRKRPSVLWPFLTATACTLLGLVLLHPGTDPATPRHHAATPASQPPTRTHQANPTPDARKERQPEKTSPPSAHPAANEIPVPGEGPAGDHAVQALLDQSSRRDLPRTRERELVALASRIWRAEVTGAERTRWPAYFTGAPLRAPYRDVRVQAGIARTVDGRDDQVRVRLVWAGTSPAGQKADGRLALIRLDRRGDTWRPVR